MDQVDSSADAIIPVLLGDAGGTIPLGAWPAAKGLKSEGIFCQPDSAPLAPAAPATRHPPTACSPTR